MPVSHEQTRLATPAIFEPEARLALDLTAAEFDALNAGEDAGVSYRDLFWPHAELPRALRNWADTSGLRLRGLNRITLKRGGLSRKLLFGLPDGYAVESVLIRRRDGHTACISSQVGCAFACQFCASGQAGLRRNLLAGEIVEQVVQLGPKVNRIVFMGIGEPLNNYDQVMKAIRILRDRRGCDFPTTGITISTIGIPKALKQLREEHLGMNLTISLHATTQEIRDRLIPGARKHDIAEVISRALSWAARHNRTVTFVYLILPGINDTPTDPTRLARMLAGQRARVNLTRWNPVDGIAIDRTPDRSLRMFRSELERAHVPVVVRDTQGRDISAACGQLWLRDITGLRVDKYSAQRKAAN
ncbi:23S rRNA (adenine(2503)-C(2))-methyltransferase RlmN [Ensifer sp. SL37]|uniref:23S rRNA (adenine(2503)-C(2))-methyltransferase RlmN n=1 Tax=Ensifer sp. SL37 TaxID=2995137 RepID=UPI0022769587|nr:23S rRNA (adenine(2503)-C(2))-methyltransferase RlmN [Ensifer sp. SL37]MCY1745067.1 23S rRNA (adenine(2503)-C(2))-methyltransferase RlmN [Ensifer sp. SL37]